LKSLEYKTLTISITLGEVLEDAAVDHAIGECDYRSDPIHLLPREFTLVQEEIQHERDEGSRSFLAASPKDSADAVAQHGMREEDQGRREDPERPVDSADREPSLWCKNGEVREVLGVE